MWQILVTILILYSIGVYIAIELVDLVEYTVGIKFEKSERIKLGFGSWYTCIILNDVLNKWYD